MTFKEIETTLADILTASEQRKADYQQKIESASQGEHEALMKAAEAYKCGDVNAYHVAQDQLRQCRDTAEMFTRMLEEEGKKPLLSDEDYQNYLHCITSTLDETTATAKKKILELLNKIISVSEKNSEAIEIGNKLMHTLQFEIMGDDACMTNQAGLRVWQNYLEKKYVESDISPLKDTIRDNWLYKKLTDGKAE